ncbi:UNVERIFIED_CONTAM: hypothetical protein Slati_1390100 [Sesamum latifolium]|uniref:Retrotransposon gag domain-containing protein n=1 Tax=Sesamum latifolium TaxID=2727402 RepID=A0AAW2X6G4_9LAMI
MEGTSRRDNRSEDEETPVRREDQFVRLTQVDVQRMIDEASRKALVEFERRTITPAAKEGMVRKLFMGKGPEKGQSRTCSDEASSRRVAARPPGISKAEVDHVSRQIERLGLEIDDLKRRGEIVAQNRNSPFANKILAEVVDHNFRFPDLPKYDGTKDPQEHVAAFELVMNLYEQTDSINSMLFVTTLTGKAQEWFMNLPSSSIESFEQLVQKFAFHFASKRKAKRSARTCLPSDRGRMNH